VEADDVLLVHTGSVWREIPGEVAVFQRLGIGTEPDAQNPLAAKLNTALFTAAGSDAGGSGDLRFVLNKERSGNVLSQLYQTGYSGRAETGLVGNDDFGIRVSADGQRWHDALRIESASGVVSFPSGVAGAPGGNLLINPAFLVNQRAYAGTTLTAGVYGYDRWKAGAGGSTMSRLADGTISFTGSIDQVVDAAQAPALVGASNFAGLTLTFSVENLSAPMPVTIGTRSVTLTEGAGRRSVTVTLDATTTGNLLLRLQSPGTTTFLRPKLEFGDRATPWVGDWLDMEEARCRRYYHRMAASGTSLLMMAGLAQRKGVNLIDMPYAFPVPMRAAPIIQLSSMVWGNASPASNQIGCYEPASATWLASSGSVGIIAAVPATASSLVLRFQASISFGGAAGAVGQIHMGSAGYIGLQAEL
jgi:hypothetical protein